MNCRDFEQQIALYAGRDLEDAGRLEEHLAECADCRELLADLQSNQATLREIGSEPVDAAFLAAVRSGVLAGSEERRRTVWPWIAVLAAATVATLFVLAPHQPVARLDPVAVVQPPPTIETVREKVNPPVPRRRRVVRRPPVPSREPLTVKMLTDDPNIVIVWLVDQQGD